MIYVHYRRREVPAVQAQAEALLTLATAQQFSLYVEHVTTARLGARHAGRGREGPRAAPPGHGRCLSAGQTLARPLCLVLLARRWRTPARSTRGYA